MRTLTHDGFHGQRVYHFRELETITGVDRMSPGQAKRVERGACSDKECTCGGIWRGRLELDGKHVVPALVFGKNFGCVDLLLVDLQ